MAVSTQNLQYPVFVYNHRDYELLIR